MYGDLNRGEETAVLYGHEQPSRTGSKGNDAGRFASYGESHRPRDLGLGVSIPLERPEPQRYEI